MSHQLKNLVIYSKLEKDSIVYNYYNLISKEDYNERQKSYFNLVKDLVQCGKTLMEHIMLLMIEAENHIISKLIDENYQLTEFDYACIKNDLMIINWLIHYDVDQAIHDIDNQHGLLTFLLSKTSQHSQVNCYLDFFKTVRDKPIFHQQCDDFVVMIRSQGTGRFSSHVAYYLTTNNTIMPVEKYQPLKWSHIYDYDIQKERLKKNTEAFVKSKFYHHALLVGASGTGKSSSIKAIVDLYKDKRLRLIQLHKGQLSQLPSLIEELKTSNLKFIIFIDDLSFEVNEDEYKFLKSFIEGGVLNETNNVAFYVTSNRRHLIKEIRSDREGDIHLQDFIQEMTSLSDRFGLYLTFESLTQKAYLEMVFKMIQEEKLEYDRKWVEGEAKKWSIRQGGMSGRVANQFVKQLHMIGEDL
ncbi:ATP-binding protein [Petrocella sp. FN5]|uniref:ATP-binding protein n=1 Tax=Petrocella sp. FN5 TaxID=3032002 RepID=UPI0023DA77AC|nr:DUF815 domain-containing protein [Petrocella sp. FN5]MDF1617738.1 DUF815 domain-containing protein [Petrocella sp. FN5]